MRINFKSCSFCLLVNFFTLGKIDSIHNHLEAQEYHVSVTGRDTNAGSKSEPFKTITAAAQVAQPGDVITVYAGIYREHVNPPRGGESDVKRIVYQAALGEKVTITGSEIAKGWEKCAGDTWKIKLPNSYFGSFNPFAEKIHGDWFSPGKRSHLRGSVYWGKDWLLEAPDLDTIMKPVNNSPKFFAESGNTVNDFTVIYAQFPGANPNEENIEISKRATVFTPDKTNIDFLTVRGFDLRNAATNWAPPTAGQIGLITAYWCKSWIIENNEVSNSRCSGISLGKYSDQWDNKRKSAEGYLRTIDDAIKHGRWSKENIGGHIVRNNHIHHCEQAGIVGSLGCIFSKIIGNEIHDIHVQDAFGGAEMAGIKFHAAIDLEIKGNHVYRCGSNGGIWLDWMAQGTQVTNNLLHDNQSQDIFCEVNHGPYLIANNILLSSVVHFSCSQGGAYVHNLIAGKMTFMSDKRKTPFHKTHSTEILGIHDCPSGDVRFFNNVFMGRIDFRNTDANWPVSSFGGVYMKSATPSKLDAEFLSIPTYNPDLKLTQEADGWYLQFSADLEWSVNQKRQLVTTNLLGKAKIPNQPYENFDGSPIKIDTDYFGKKRDVGNPFPGPFEVSEGGLQKYKVW